MKTGTCVLTAAACGLLMVSGCQSGTGGRGSFSWTNPFASTKTAETSQAPKRDVAKKPRKPTVNFVDELSRGRTLEKAGKYDEARPIYERLLVEFPDRYEPYHRLAVVADRQKRFTEAQGLYSEAIRLEPTNPDLFNDLGYCLFLQGKLDKAEAATVKAVGLAPANPRYRNNLGMVYGHQGRYDEALDQFRRAGSEADARYNLAFVKASQNDFEGAKECFHQALASDPTYEPARRALASFRKTEEDPLGQFDNSPIVKDGTYWVPYTEDGNADAGKAQTASHNSPPADVKAGSPARNPVTAMRSSAQSQLRQARVDSASRIQQGYSE